MKELPNVRLRAMEPEDLDLLYKIENDISLWGVGITNVPYSRYTLHNYIADSAGDIYTDRQVRMMVDNEENETVGIVDIQNFDPRHRRAELGIVIKNKFRHKGYASSSVRQIMRYAREVLHLHQLYVIIAEDNAASLKFFGNSGFKESQTLKHWLYDGKEYRDAVLMQYFL